ncbi:hypothetical protein [Solitalea koreensis]|nr:hypothetical protein [Solitalea koreensis]
MKTETIELRIIDYFLKNPDKEQRQIAKEMKVTQFKVSTVLSNYFKQKQPN